MAHISLQMTATGGIADEHCSGCDKPFERGERMNGIKYENGEPGGWHCDACVEYWKKNSKPRVPDKEQVK